RSVRCRARGARAPRARMVRGGHCTRGPARHVLRRRPRRRAHRARAARPARAHGPRAGLPAHPLRLRPGLARGRRALAAAAPPPRGRSQSRPALALTVDALHGRTDADRTKAASLETAEAPRTRARVAALGYHEVADAPGESGFRRAGARPYRFSRAELDAHLDAIAASGSSVACVDALDLGAPGVRTVLTFDDGGRSALAAAAALERRGWRGHFFIITSRIGTPGFLDAAGIRRLHRAGHVIG